MKPCVTVGYFVIASDVSRQTADRSLDSYWTAAPATASSVSWREDCHAPAHTSAPSWQCEVADPAYKVPLEVASGETRTPGLMFKVIWSCPGGTGTLP